MDRRSYSWVWILTAGEELRAYSDLSVLEREIQRERFTGTATLYPINVSVHEWAIREECFTPKRENQKIATFILRFSSASQPHFHFEDGAIETGESEEVLGRCRLAAIEKVFCVKLDSKSFPSAIFDNREAMKLWIASLAVRTSEPLPSIGLFELEVRRS